MKINLEANEGVTIVSSGQVYWVHCDGQGKLHVQNTTDGSPELSPDEKLLIKRDKFIQAIKAYRNRTNSTLVVARDMCMAYRDGEQS